MPSHQSTRRCSYSSETRPGPPNTTTLRNLHLHNRRHKRGEGQKRGASGMPDIADRPLLMCWGLFIETQMKDRVLLMTPVKPMASHKHTEPQFRLTPLKPSANQISNERYITLLFLDLLNLLNNILKIGICICIACIMKRINLGMTKYDVIEGLDRKCSSHHWG